MNYFDFIIHYIDDNQNVFTKMSDEIWGFAEPRFQEYQSSQLQQDYMRQQGFLISADLAGEKTAFIAEYGEGKPVIAFLGEFDSLPGLSQKADKTCYSPIIEGGNGHGCGHNLLGCASLTAAVTLKAYMQSNHISGTVRYYGCPAEENAGGKAYLVRDGYFNDCDIAITWHPGTVNKVTDSGSLANFRAFFTFKGIPAHAAGCPELGRSALDAVELMDVGVNYMREHMIDQARIHYAITNPGGNAPNVVQQEAQVLYAVRAPKIFQVKELFDRVCKIAKGAAMMTETEVTIRQVAAYSDYIANPVISEQLGKNMDRIFPIYYTKEELAYAQQFKNVITELDRKALKSTAADLFGKEAGTKLLEQPIFTEVSKVVASPGSKGSTDVGDVSWVCPTGQISTACWAQGTAGHSWQVVAQGKSEIAHKGFLAASKVMAVTGCEFLMNPELVKKAHASWITSLDGEKYPNPLPADVKPTLW